MYKFIVVCIAKYIEKIHKGLEYNIIKDLTKVLQIFLQNLKIFVTF